MAHGMNDTEVSIDAGTLLKQMKERLAFINSKITELKPLETEALRLRAAINAYENHDKPTVRSRGQSTCDEFCSGCDVCRRGPGYR